MWTEPLENIKWPKSRPRELVYKLPWTLLNNPLYHQEMASLQLVRTTLSSHEQTMAMPVDPLAMLIRIIPDQHQEAKAMSVRHKDNMDHPSYHWEMAKGMFFPQMEITYHIHKVLPMPLSSLM